MTDKFSLHRLDLIWSYYSPAIMRQWRWTIVAISIMFGLALLARTIESTGLFSMVNTLLLFPVYLGPLVFTVYDDRSMQIQLPATAAEKATFYVLHSLVIVPLAVLALWISLNSLSGAIFGDGIYNYFMDTMLEDFTERGIEVLSPVFIIQRLFMELMPVAVVLLTVLAARRHRVIKGIGAAIGTLLAYGVISGLTGFFVAFTEANHLETLGKMDFSGEEATQFVTDIMSRLLNILTCVTVVGLAVTIVLIYRQVRRMQA